MKNFIYDAPFDNIVVAFACKALETMAVIDLLTDRIILHLFWFIVAACVCSR
jgi:hypothetical protein